MFRRPAKYHECRPSRVYVWLMSGCDTQASLDEAIFPGVSERRLGGRLVVMTAGAHGIGRTVAQALIAKRRRPGSSAVFASDPQTVKKHLRS
jgi:hypothetical protein